MASLRPPQRVRALRRPVPAEHAGIEPRTAGTDRTRSMPIPARSKSGRTRSADKRPSSPGDQRDAFAGDLANEIIPRLLLAHRNSKDHQDVTDATPLNELESTVRARQLCFVALREGARGTVRFAEKLLDQGCDLRIVLTEVIAGAARQMGQLWESDELDFIEVTLGVSVLQQTVRHLANKLPAEFSSPAARGRAAFTPSRGEQHTFGLMMVEELYRAYGWEVSGGAEINFEDTCKIASRITLKVVGFTLSTPDRLDQLTAEIEILRKSSCSPDLTVLVGGNAFLENPESWRSTGADAMAVDAIEAIRIGERLISADRQARPVASTETQLG